MGIAVVAIIGSMIWYSSRPGRYDAFAACLGEKGAVFYGAFWCPHCQEQKALFGRSARDLPYVECSTPNGQSQLPVCEEKGVESYPTWHFADGSVRKGTLSLNELASITECPLVTE